MLLVTSTADMQYDEVTLFEGPASVKDRLRIRRGRLSLSDRELCFAYGGSETHVALDTVAWVEARRKGRDLILEITTRTAGIHRWMIDDPAWVQRVRTASRSVAAAMANPTLSDIRVAS